ncbi:MAG: transposase [Christensenellales bacterium]
MAKSGTDKKYTGEFKQMVVETMRKELLSYQETARRFEVRSDTQVKNWERIYFEEGAEGLHIERRGRKSTGRPKKLKPEAEEDLIAEVQRLRAENAYLKKLRALVLEEERRGKGRK